MAIISIITFLVVIGIAAQFGLRLIIRYDAGDRELRIRFVGITVVRVPYQQITGVTKVRFLDVLIPRSGATFNGIRAGNRIVFREAVVVERTEGMRKFVILTPDVPSAFVAELKERISRAKQPGA